MSYPTALAPPRLPAKYEVVGLVAKPRKHSTLWRVRVGRSRYQAVIKVLAAGLAEDEFIMERFRQEAFLPTLIDSPYVVKVYDWLECPEQPMIEMEYVEGPVLREVIQNAYLGFEASAALTLDIARAMNDIHTNGVVHCDLTPANFILDPWWRLRLCDFGIACYRPFSENGHPRSRHIEAQYGPLWQRKLRLGSPFTRIGETCGNPWYMAPEQMGAWGFGPNVDIFTAGALFYEILTGKPLNHGGTALEVCLRHKDLQRTINESGLPQRWKDLIGCMVHEHLEDRPQSARAVLGLLEDVMD